MKFLLIILIISCSCGKIKDKDNEPLTPVSSEPSAITQRFSLYKQQSKAAYDDYGLYAPGGHIGDSALFSCLAYNADLTKFDIGLLFRDNGMPRRHPDISKEHSATPISKDMVSGILWCLYKLQKTDPDYAVALTSKMIKAGKSHAVSGLWSFCTKDDIKEYSISKEDVAGRCIMTPGVMKDVYRLHLKMGGDCDNECKTVMTVGVNTLPEGEGFTRHLAVLSTVRNGLIEGGINDLSLKQLEKAHKAEPRNALYAAAYNMFKGGFQDETWKILSDESLFPLKSIPTSKNYCTDYLFQRDEVVLKSIKPYTNAKGEICAKYYHPETKKPVEGCGLKQKPDGTVQIKMYNKDWLPCVEDKTPKGMADWGFARFLSVGGI